MLLQILSTKRFQIRLSTKSPKNQECHRCCEVIGNMSGILRTIRNYILSFIRFFETVLQGQVLYSVSLVEDMNLDSLG
ncbi:hypothetical protein M758_8G002900 [Ceratodon purpureus]|uniref:Uncharacterized protein n=1 Tax=Ceratodon purpureus TaxID=3225 RepID=A0A8T0GZ84_CERPU|nr:hypothetical protein KC19_8G003600 [Ceratodon purpureus]KAG0607094.1 hypothetical protein M758_8G002900 [Ceratodon purpureus]